MRWLSLLVFGALLACSWAEKAEVGESTGTKQQRHKFRQEELKKKVVADIMKVKMSHAPEGVQRQELKNIFNNLKRYEEKTPQATVSKEEIVQAVKKVEKNAKGFTKQQRKGKKARKPGASLRRLSEETARASAPGQTRQRRAALAKKIHTSFARAT
jgi:transcriptional regulator of acetoin/glycerol metabolism